MKPKDRIDKGRKRLRLKRPLKKNRETISDQIRSIPDGDKREWLIKDVNVNSYRTKVGEMNVWAGYSKYGLRTYPDYGTMVITNYG